MTRFKRGYATENGFKKKAAIAYRPNPSERALNSMYLYWLGLTSINILNLKRKGQILVVGNNSLFFKKKKKKRFDIASIICGRYLSPGC